MSEWQWLSYDDAYPGSNHTVTGNVRVLRGVGGHGVPARDLLVYLPPGYWTQPDRKFPVLYMQDGQNVFDAVTSYAGEWRADETANWLAGEGIELIIVAIPHGGTQRMAEYGGWARSRQQASPYLDFLTGTVRPIVAESWRTLSDPEHTGIVGSSMGGLMSLYAGLSRPDVFGYCAALSPSLWYARRRLPELIHRGGPKARVYLDVGILEGMGYVRQARLLSETLARAGYDVVYVEDALGGHDEASWARRLPGVIEWFVDPALRPSTVSVSTLT